VGSTERKQANKTPQVWKMPLGLLHPPQLLFHIGLYKQTNDRLISLGMDVARPSYHPS
jgi:hypothetical protein